MPKRTGTAFRCVPARNEPCALPVNGSTHLIPALLLIYRPRKDERLSWPSRLICSGWFIHISGHPSAAGQAQDRESSPVIDRRSTTVLRHQPLSSTNPKCAVFPARNMGQTDRSAVAFTATISLNHTWTQAAVRFGLTISRKKTEVLLQPVDRLTSTPPVVMAGETALPVVQRFCYLGSVLSSDANIDEDIFTTHVFSNLHT